MYVCVSMMYVCIYAFMHAGIIRKNNVIIHWLFWNHASLSLIALLRMFRVDRRLLCSFSTSDNSQTGKSLWFVPTTTTEIDNKTQSREIMRCLERKNPKPAQVNSKNQQTMDVMRRM